MQVETNASQASGPDLSNSELIQLLSELEHASSSLGRLVARNDFAGGLKVIHTLVTHLVRFAETGLGEGSVAPADQAAAMAKAGAFFHDYSEIEGELNPSVWKSAARLFRKPTQDPAEIRNRTRQLLVDGVAVMADYFHLCCSSIADKAAAQSYVETCDEFLNELKRLTAQPS